MDYLNDSYLKDSITWSKHLLKEGLTGVENSSKPLAA